MNQTTRELYKKASELSAEERVELAGLLLESIEDQDAPRAEIERAWTTEMERRLAEYRAGRMETVSWEDLRAHLHRSGR
jgi:putative addiction module component (TIGR02574 family)